MRKYDIHQEQLRNFGQALAQCRRDGVVSRAPAASLMTEADALDVQSMATACYGDDPAGYAVVGWSVSAQQRLGLNGPIHGVIPQDGAQPASGEAFRLPQGVIGAQCELVFTIGCPVTGGKDAHVSHDCVRQAIVACRPAIGIVGRRVSATGGLHLAAIADFALHVTTIYGEPADRHALSRLDLAWVRARLAGNDVLRACGLPYDPVAPVVWLANTLLRMGQCLDAGDIVACGALAPILQVLPGQTLSFEVAGFGHCSSAFL